jgi:transglutaminase-like putative cysteine protease
MRLRLLHRRLAVLMCFAGLLAFAGGAGFEPVSAVLVTAALLLALFWQPDRTLSARMERVWLPLAALLIVRALIHVFIIRDDVVIPVVDLLLMLMAAEALRSLDAPNDIRLYSLSFALVLASTAYRPGILFLLAFVAYVATATVALTVGHIRRSAERHGLREIPLGRRVIGTTLSLSSVVLLVAALVFVTFPRVSRGWAGRGRTEARSIVGFGNVVSIGEYGTRIYGNPEIALRVEFPQGRPANMLDLHWRGRSYDHFDGVRWSRSQGLPPSAAPTEWYRERWSGPLVVQRIYEAPLDVRVLFALHPVLGIDPDEGIQPLSDNAGDFVYWGSGVPSYTVFSRGSEPAPAALRAAAAGYAPPARYFLQLPEHLDPRIPALADSLTKGLTTTYDKAMAIERWLQTFRYTVELPATAGDATLAHFLFVRKAGHCEYFSTAMAVLLRTLGIEARNVNGFLGGEWSQFGHYLVVTQNQAHSWVEVWFPQYGWVTFDPTPSAGDVSEGRESWFWPGRILLDGIQHRWDKWVLDYNARSQEGVFQRWAEVLGNRPVDQGGRQTQSPGGHHVLAVLVMALLLVVGLAWARRGGGPRRLESRLYLRLRASCERAGIPVPPGLTPLALVDRVRATHGGAAAAAERVVDLYLRSRYGGEALGESERHEMKEALNVARRLMRARA